MLDRDRHRTGSVEIADELREQLTGTHELVANRSPSPAARVAARLPCEVQRLPLVRPVWLSGSLA